MENGVTSARQKAASAALFLFAFVGFIASIVAIMAYFQPSGGGDLRVEIEPNDFQMPLEVAAPFEDKSHARRMLEDMESSFCNPTEEKGEAETQKPQKLSQADQAICDQASSIGWLGRWANAYAESPGVLYRYEIENRGSSAARNIRIAAKGVASLQLERGEDFADIQEDKGGDYFSLPDLNPDEKAVLLIWMTTKSFSYPDYDDAPKVTFAGASVSTELYQRVPDGWWNLYDWLGDTPTILLIIFIVAISFAITIAFVLIVSILEALVTGKPLSSVFATSKPKVEAEADA